MKNIYFLVFLTAGGCLEKNSGSYSITAKLDTSYATIGDLVQLEISVKGDLNKMLTFPDWALESPIEIRSMVNNESEGKIIFNLAFWDTGKITIPAYAVEIFNRDSSLVTSLLSKPLDIEIISVVDMDPSLKNSAAGLKDVKDPVVLPWSGNWRLFLNIFLLIFILAAIIIIGLKKHKKTLFKEMEKIEFTENADVRALRRLNELKNNKLLNKNDIKYFYVLLSTILREYVENSLFIRTLEMTTSEIQDNKKLFPYSEADFKTVIKILTQADKVKFARQIPDLLSCSKDLNQVAGLISSISAVPSLQ